MAVRYSPRGRLIVGTLESLQGTAHIKDFNDDGTFEYTGETDVCYDTTETMKDKNGERIFLDQDGVPCPESKLRKTKPRKR
jgi:hypothetical protein